VADRRNLAIEVVLRRLRSLKRRFTWIQEFRSQPKGGEGKYSIWMIASRTEVDPDYTEEEPTGPAFINYRTLDGQGRPTGIQARIKRPIRGGTHANHSIRPPGFLGGAANHARGHLLARQLGGSGDDRRNLVTLIHIPVNTPIMRGFETRVRRAVDARETVLYTVKPNYRGRNPMPVSITIEARGNKGFTLEVTFPNRE